jgi:hypothetical protein
MEKIGHPISRKWGKEGLILKPYPHKYGIMAHTKGARKEEEELMTAIMTIRNGSPKPDFSSDHPC